MKANTCGADARTPSQAYQAYHIHPLQYMGRNPKDEGKKIGSNRLNDLPCFIKLSNDTAWASDLHKPNGQAFAMYTRLSCK